jgi:hypothetical protein
MMLNICILNQNNNKKNKKIFYLFSIVYKITSELIIKK